MAFTPGRLSAALGCALGILTISACGGGGGAGVSPGLSASTGSGGSPAPAATGSPAPTASPAPTPSGSPAPASSLPQTIVLTQGGTDGIPNQFTPTRGDTPSGGSGQDVDGIPCLATIAQNQFHIHSFVGVLVNGTEIALPDSVGMVGFGAETNGFVNSAQCFYEIHLHDRSGIIHQEAASTTPNSGSLFTVGNLLDIWGETISPTNFGPFAGAVRVFAATAPLGSTLTSGYSEVTTDPRAIRLFSHEVVWIEVGPTFVPAANLPTIRFFTEF